MEPIAPSTVVISYLPREGDLRRQVAESLAGGAKHVVVDLGDAQSVDASTLTTLRRSAAKLRARGSRVSVVCAHPELRRLLELTLLSSSFDVYGSLDAALREP